MQLDILLTVPSVALNFLILGDILSLTFQLQNIVLILLLFFFLTFKKMLFTDFFFQIYFLNFIVCFVTV